MQQSVYATNGTEPGIAFATSAEVEAALGRPWPADVAMPVDLSLDGLLDHLEQQLDVPHEVRELFGKAIEREEQELACEPMLPHEACWAEVVEYLQQNCRLGDEVLYQLRRATCRAALGALDRCVADRKTPLAYFLARRLERGDWLR